MNLEQILPTDIEERSLEITTEELDSRTPDPENEAVIKRVIHTTVDFDYTNNLTFSPHAVTKGLETLHLDASITTDANMNRAGINKTAPHKTGNEVCCFVADEDVTKTAREAGTIRAATSIDKTAALSSQGEDCIFAIGNAPTALIRIKELVDQGRLHPKLIIAVPVGFVNMVQARELILNLDIPYIIAKGREDGSNVAAAICNTLLYQLYI